MKWWIKCVAAVLVILLLALLCISLVKGISGVLLRGETNAAEPDPMFETPAETVSPPPQLYAEETQRPHKTLDDYVPEVLSPVDKTAAELIEEAKGRSASP